MEYRFCAWLDILHTRGPILRVLLLEIEVLLECVASNVLRYGHYPKCGAVEPLKGVTFRLYG